MKRTLSTLAVFCLAAGWSPAMEEDHTPPTHEGSAELQRVKSLAGVWVGRSVMGEREHDAKVTYEVTSGGSAVVETLSPGSPHEMVSMYHDDEGKLSMTHYCTLGNQPRMKLQEDNATSLTLAMSGSSGITDPNEPHMHALKITFVDDDTMKHEWTHYDQGKEAGTVEIIFRRQD